MKLQKKVVKIGGSLGIIFDKIIVNSYGLNAGDIVDISDIVIKKKSKELENDKQKKT
jgi:antitoxin component of MazEF toxin-antitoxin module